MQLIHINIALSFRVLHQLVLLYKSSEHIFVLGLGMDGAGRLAVGGAVALDFGREDLGCGGLLLREEVPAVVLADRLQLTVRRRRRLPQHRLLVQRQVLVRMHNHGRGCNLRSGILGWCGLRRLSCLLRFLLCH